MKFILLIKIKIFYFHIKRKILSASFEEALEMVLNDDRPLKIINAYKNISAAIIKLQILRK